MERNLFGQCIWFCAHSISQDPFCEYKGHFEITSDVISPLLFLLQICSSAQAFFVVAN